MGFQIKFNWVLQIDCDYKINNDQEYNFVKSGNRVFPLDTPIDLIDLKRTAIAKIKILEFSNTENQTTGKFIVLKKYSGEEKEILSNYWIENQ